LLWHEDQGLMGQFAVVEPGQAVISHDHENLPGKVAPAGGAHVS
jgi:hypothetical protein